MKNKWSPRLWVAGCLFALSGAATAQNAVTTDATSVYAGPDDSYPVVAQLDPSTPVQVNGCLDDWSWCDVSFADYRGWLYAPDITYDYDGGYVPFYTYAPSFGVPVVTFEIGAYWDRYYHGRPWYGRRDEWVHREPPHHRPPGPPPHSGQPPRSARMDRPPHGGVPGRPHEPPPDRRVGTPDPHHDAGRADHGPGHDDHAPGQDNHGPGHTDHGPARDDHRSGSADHPAQANHATPDRGQPPRPEAAHPVPQPHPAPSAHVAPPRPEPPAHPESAPHPAPQAHEAPAPHDEHAAPARPAGPRHDERPQQPPRPPAPEQHDEHPH